MLALGLEATAHYGLRRPTSRSATSRCSPALIAALDFAPAWKRRLIKDFNRKTNLAQDLDRLVLGGTNARPEYQGVLAALAGSDPKGARALVTDLCRSPASPLSAGVRSAKLPTVFSNSRRSAPAPRCRTTCAR